MYQFFYALINDFMCANYLHKEIMLENATDWKYYGDKYGLSAKNLYKNDFLNLL